MTAPSARSASSPPWPSRPAGAAARRRGHPAPAAQAGNHSVASALLARRKAEDTLPPIADNLRRFREGCPRLKALAARRPPVVPAAGFVDIAPALEWLRELVDTLKVVEPIVDPSMLVFESVVVSGHDEEYGQAGSEISPRSPPRSERSSRSRATSARRSCAS